VFSRPEALYFGLISTLTDDNNTTDITVLKQFLDSDNNRSLILFPEGASTNGKCALLRYLLKSCYLFLDFYLI